MTLSKFIKGALIATAALILLACTPKEQNAKDNAQDVQKLTLLLDWFVNPNHAAIIMAHPPGQPEIAHLDPLAVVNHQVRGLDIAVHQPPRMERTQGELKQKHVEAASGGGMVTAVANGSQELVSLKIKPDAVDPNDLEMLEDLVVAAVNQALDKSRKLSEEEMGKVTGGFKIPGLF